VTSNINLRLIWSHCIHGWAVQLLWLTLTLSTCHRLFIFNAKFSYYVSSPFLPSQDSSLLVFRLLLKGLVYASCRIWFTAVYVLISHYHHHHHHHHHHHVPEGLGVFPVPWSSRWSWSLHLFLGRPMFLRPFGLYCSACFGILFCVHPLYVL